MFIPADIQLSKENILFLLGITKDIYLPNLVADLIQRSDEYILLANFIIEKKYIIGGLIKLIGMDNYIDFIIKLESPYKELLIKLSIEFSNYGVYIYKRFWNNFEDCDLNYFSKKEFVYKYMESLTDHDTKVLKNAVVSLEEYEMLDHFKSIILILCNIKFSSDFIIRFLELPFKYNSKLIIPYHMIINLYTVMSKLDSQPRLKVFLGFAHYEKIDLNKLWGLTNMDKYNDLFQLYKLSYSLHNFKKVFDVIRFKKDKKYEFLLCRCHFMKHDHLMDLMKSTKFT